MNENPEFQRTTRSRSNSLTESNNTHIVNFEKPTTIESPGTYHLNDINSGCSVLLFNNVFLGKSLKQFSGSIDTLKTLKQYQSKTSGHLIPRLSAWYGPIDYAYSGVVMRANKISDVPIISAAYKHISDSILKPNGIEDTSDCFLVNKYRDGKDSVGEHSDNEPEVDQTSPIITLSTGQTRTMLIREASKSGNAIAIRLKPGSVLIMQGSDFQKKFSHQIPKDPSSTLPRISITYRKCNPDVVDARNALSTPLVQFPIPQKLIDDITSSKTADKRRSSLPDFNKVDSPKGGKQSPLCRSPFASPYASSNADSPSSNKSTESMSKFSKADNESLPLSLDALLEAVDYLKDSTIKQELHRHGIPASTGTPQDRKKRLKKAVRDSHKEFISKSLAMVEPDSVTFTNMISTLEDSIVNLQEEIQTQCLAIDALSLSQTPEKSNSKAEPTAPSNELNKLGLRLEKVEDLLNTLSENQQASSGTVDECKKMIETIENNSEASWEILKTGQMPEEIPSDKNKQPQASDNTSNMKSSKVQFKQPAHGSNTSINTPRTRHTPSHKVLLIHDSQLNSFVPENFSSSFSVEKFKAGSYNDLINTHMRSVISKPAVDCYVLQLGINDFRYDTSEANMNKSIENTKTCIQRLLERSSAKIVVSLPTPTPGNLDTHTSKYVENITSFITEKRKLYDNHQRLFTVNNQSGFKRAIELSKNSGVKPSPIDIDNLHVSPYGLKKLCMNIKFGIYRSFGIRLLGRQAPPVS